MIPQRIVITAPPVTNDGDRPGSQRAPLSGKCAIRRNYRRTRLFLPPGTNDRAKRAVMDGGCRRAPAPAAGAVSCPGVTLVIAKPEPPLINISATHQARLILHQGLMRRFRPTSTSTRRDAMNWDQIEGKWKQVQGKVLEKWGKLTNDDLDQIAGKRDQLVGKVQEKYGLAKEAAEREVDEWTRGS
jgi:uncharacterized protein YjbJ (UPF0337 family)